MATVNLVIEQVNHKIDDSESETSARNISHSVLENALGAVVDPNIDFLRRTPAVNDGLSDCEDAIEEDRPSSTETVTEVDVPKSSATKSVSKAFRNKANGFEIPEVHKENCPAQVQMSKSVSHNDEGISDMAYPQISYPVAQYLFETNPGLTEKMEKILVSGGSSQMTSPSQSNNTSPSHSKSSTTSLSSLTCITDALGLQQSAIGSSQIKVPAATELEVVNAIKKIEHDKELAEKNYRKTYADMKSGNNLDATKSTNKVGRPQELVPYPHNRITRIVEKTKSWFGSGNNESSESGIQENGSSSDISNNCVASDSLDSGYVRKFDNRMDNLSLSKMENDNIRLNDHVFNDRLETASNFSERFEVMSNISGVSSFEEEMTRIKKLLVDNIPDANKFPIAKEPAKKKSPKIMRNSSTSTDSPRFLNRNLNQENGVSDDKNSELIFQMQREKANLEGKIEVMQSEMELGVEEKARMQATIASLQSQLKVQITNVHKAQEEKELTEQDTEKLMKSSKEYKSNIHQLENAIERYEMDVKMLKEQLDEVDEDKSRMKINSEELKIDLENKNGTIDGLKKKIAELHVSLQTMNQTNIQIQNDQSSMKSEIVSLNKSKAWYQQQLHLVQEERGELQQSLMESQSKVISHSNDAERLRCETVQLKQQLSETQRRAMREKETLMHHLETIEADMVEREALFEQLQRDRGNVEEGLAAKLKKVEEDKSKMNNLIFNVKDLTNQVETAKMEMQTKDSNLSLLEKDRANVMKDLVLKEKELNLRNVTMQQLENQKREAELRTKQLQLDLKNLEDQYLKLKTEKTNTDVSLVAANNEKKEVSEALGSLKSNLMKVEANFKQLRTDLVRKTSDLEKCQRERDQFKTSLEHAEQNLSSQKQEFESQVCMDSQQRGLIVSDLKRQKTELEKVLTALRTDLRKSQIDLVKSEDLRVNLERKLQEISSHWNETRRMLQTVTEEKEFMEGRLQVQEKQVHLKNIDYEHNLYKTRAKELQETLDQCRSEFYEKQKSYKLNIKVLMKKLRQLREKAEGEMKLRIEAEKLEAMNGDLGDADELKVLNDRLMKEIDDYKEKLVQSEQIIATLNNRYEEQKKIADENQRLAIDLEREKGRLAGVSENHCALKQHTSHLEATLAQREFVVSELNNMTKEVADKQRYDEAKLHEKIIGLEEALNREKNSMKELRKQLFQDKRENSNLKRHLKTLKDGLEGANQSSDSKKMEVIRLKSELDVKVQAELKHRAEIEAMHTELKKTKAEVDRLTRAVDDSNARDPVLTQQMKTLSWHLKQKNEEISGIQKQLKLLQETHNSEIEAAKASHENLEFVAEELRKDLVEVRKEKFVYQGKVNELKSALKSHMEQNKRIVEKFNEIQKSSSSLTDDVSLPESPTPFDDSYVNQLLEESISVPQTRPLSNLKTCLNALKTEVGELMKQLKTEDEENENDIMNSKKTNGDLQHLQEYGIKTV